MKLIRWWSNLWGFKDRSGLLVAPPLIKFGSRPLPLNLPDIKEWRGQGQASDSQLSPLKKEADLLKPRPSLYWCNFRKPNGEFDCVVITWGTSPGSAANSAIEAGIVESFNASVVVIPVDKEWRFEPHQGIRLTEADVRSVFPDIPMIEKTIDISG